MVISNVDEQLWFRYPGATERTLKHYGVLGMRWGIRKDQQLTSGGRIKKGTKISRLTTSPNEKHKGSTYAIAKTNKGSFPEGEEKFISTWISNNPNTKVYKIDMKLKTDLILPSMKEKGETFVADILSDPTMSKRILKASDEFLGPDRLNTDFAKGRKSALSASKKLKNIELDSSKTGFESFKDPKLQDAYTAFTQALNDKTIRGAYIESLSKKGFSGVSDDLMDADIKKMLYSNREYAMQKRTDKGSNIGTAVGVAVGLPLSVATGSPNVVYLTGVGGRTIGYGLAAASNKSALPNDKSAYGTSSVIIFDREDSLDIIRTKPYKGM